jgi:peptidoglycan/xylan/chitin deacetylase (PgdA/CDA1 family)
MEAAVIKLIYVFLLLLPSLIGLTTDNIDNADYNVAVLTYHQISDSDDYANSDASIVHVDTFYEQMLYLSENDFNVISLDEFYDYYLNSYFPEKSVLITFDDGYSCFYNHAYEILTDFDFSATLFPITSHRNDLNRILIFNDHLSFHHLRLMDNIYYGSHTHNLHYHDEIFAIDKALDESDKEYIQRIKNDLLLSKLLLDQQTDQNIKALAWPYGFYNEKTIKIASLAGFEMLITLNEGKFNTDMCLLEIPRFNVTNQTIEEFSEWIN